MNQTKKLKKIADMEKVERTRARKDLRYYPVPGYLKALGLSSMTDLTEEMPLVYRNDNPFFPEDGCYIPKETPEGLEAGALSERLGQICKVKLGFSAHPDHLLAAMHDGKTLYQCMMADGKIHWCDMGEIEAAGELALSEMDVAALQSPQLRAAADWAFQGDSVDMNRWVYCLRGPWSVTYFVLVEKGE